MGCLVNLTVQLLTNIKMEGVLRGVLKHVVVAPRNGHGLRSVQIVAEPLVIEILKSPTTKSPQFQSDLAVNSDCGSMEVGPTLGFRVSAYGSGNRNVYHDNDASS